MQGFSKVLIISEDSDLSTDDVMFWHYHYGASIFRVSDAASVQFQFCMLSNEKKSVYSFSDNNVIINLSDFDGIWYRRGHLMFRIENSFSELFYTYRSQEEAKLNEHFDTEIEGIKHINHYKDNFVNKVNVLKTAKQIGIKIPETYIVSFKSDIPSSPKHRYITKAISEMGRTFKYKGYTIGHSTTVQLVDDIKTISDTFFPSLIQQYIDKRFEIRTFYLDEKFYSMAIFSQENIKTKVDFRNYDNERPNRCVPYKLPEYLEVGLTELMKTLNLNSGSIDLICTNDNEYYFLEVNPIGQFQWLSKNCNYYIERLIAEYLTS